MIAFLLGLSWAVLPHTGSPTHFSRTFEPDETQTYKFDLVADKLKLGIEDTIQISVKKVGSGTQPTTVEIESQYHHAVSGDPGPAPQALTTTIGRHGMPNDLSMTGNNYIFLLSSLAGYTPDKDVDNGDSYVIEWGNKKESIKVHGRATITAINDAAQTITTHSVASILVDDQPLGKATFTSVYNLKTGALIRSSGSFGIPKLTYVVVIKSVN